MMLSNADDNILTLDDLDDNPVPAVADDTTATEEVTVLLFDPGNCKGDLLRLRNQFSRRW